MARADLKRVRTQGKRSALPSRIVDTHRSALRRQQSGSRRQRLHAAATGEVPNIITTRCAAQIDAGTLLAADQ